MAGRRARFDLEIHLRPQGDSVRGAIVYSTELFDAAIYFSLNDLARLCFDYCIAHVTLSSIFVSVLFALKSK